MRGWAGAMMRAGEWVVRLACLNFLWILFTLLGVGILGLFPATAAVFSVIRKGLVDEGKTFPLFRTFWSFYRADWIPMNILMLVYSVMGLGLFLDFRLVRGWEGAAQPWVVLFLVFALSVYLLSLIHLFPLYAHYRMKLHEYVLQSFLITLYRPLSSALMGGAVYLMYAAMTWLPGTLPVFAVSLPAVVVMALSFRTFRSIDPSTAIPSTGWAGVGKKHA
jgi:uncharacterized membrane protein YesL